MGALALPSRAELEIVGVLIIIAAVLMWLGFHDAEIKAEALAPVVAVQKAQLADQKAQEAQTDAEQSEALHETTAQNAARVADARSLAAVVRGLHDDAIRPRASTQDSSASSGGDSSIGSDVVPGILYRATAAALADTADDAAGLADFSDSLRASGQLCQRYYGALSPLDGASGVK